MKPLWLKLKNKVLGEKYDLSFSYAGNDEMRRLNKLYRQKDYSANVLSFPLSEKRRRNFNKQKLSKKTPVCLFIYLSIPYYTCPA